MASERTFGKNIVAFYELTKPGITLSVVASMAIGFLLGSSGQVSLVTLLHAVIGTWMIASGTAAHNQYMERNLDKLMLRTQKRPLPMARIEAVHAKIFSLSLIFAGLLYLILTVNWLAGAVSISTSFIYLVLYTPLKQRSFWNVPVGSIAGALPPVGGWAAAAGTIMEPGVWVLFAIVFLWQTPHVLSIAWICREDYEKAGFCMLPASDDSGLKTALFSLGCLLLLLPAMSAMYSLGLNSVYFLIPALIVSGWFAWHGIRFIISREKPAARSLMFASFFYLPIIWILVLIDRLVFV